ncbi:MAG: hypothetical protein AAGG47_21360 [Pseudomonadota bacterium]
MSAFVPRDIEQAWRLSEALASQGGEMIPQAYRNKPGAVFLAVTRGAELGLAPLTAMAWVAPINGRGTLWGDALPALVQRAGHRLKEWREGEGEHMVAYCTVIRSDGTENTASFSVDQAKQAGLWNKQGPWKQYPWRMLQMRARGFAVRDGAADVLLGLSVAEEVRDYQGPDNARDVTPKTAEPGQNHILATLPAAEDQGRSELPSDEHEAAGSPDQERAGSLKADAAFINEVTTQVGDALPGFQPTEEEMEAAMARAEAEAARVREGA